MNLPIEELPDYPRVGDLVDLGEGPETPQRVIAGVAGWVWPLGTPRPAYFDVVDEEDRTYRVISRELEAPARTWSGERRVGT